MISRPTHAYQICLSVINNIETPGGSLDPLTPLH